MSLNYYLRNNPMTPDQESYFAVPQVRQTLTLEDVIKRMISRGSTVTMAEALSVFEEFSLATRQLLEEGNSVVTPLFSVNPSIVGVFTDKHDTFDRSRHQIKLRVKPGPRLKEALAQIAVEKTMAEKRKPFLVEFKDKDSETIDDIISPGGGGYIMGMLLKFDETAPEQGIFFINVSNGAVTKVVKVMRNMPGELIFINPALPAGTYKLEVRTLFNGTKTIRTGSLQDELTVA